MLSAFPPVSEPSAWLTPEAAAKKLSVSRSFIYKLIQSGRLPARRIGDKLLRINQQALDTFTFDEK